MNMPRCTPRPGDMAQLSRLCFYLRNAGYAAASRDRETEPGTTAHTVSGMSRASQRMVTPGPDSADGREGENPMVRLARFEDHSSRRYVSATLLRDLAADSGIENESNRSRHGQRSVVSATTCS